MPTVLITGASRGIGLGLVRHYAAAGWQVLACCREPEAVDAPAGVERIALDVADDARIAALADGLAGRPIDLLINNAGIYGPRDAVVGNVKSADWLEVLRVNTIAPMMVTQALLPNIRAGNRKIIAIVSSKVGSIADNSSGNSYIYRSSKTAVNQVSKSLSIDLRAEDITVVALHPGWVQTDMGGPNALISTETSI
ncbi:MAG: SDR family oxidoreductase, partial [Sphingomonadales bacterium]|nr:SDR family oxidoreductase [Sphingomonadales bacterium]